MTRIKITYTWRYIRGKQIRVMHRRRVGLSPATVALKASSPSKGWVVKALG